MQAMYSWGESLPKCFSTSQITDKMELVSARVIRILAFTSFR